jgi:uncharacterized protein (DUF58 family)
MTDDTSSVREYQHGDPLRSIHWRSVARRGHLVVKEFDVHQRAGVTIAASVPDDPAAADAVASVACSLGIAAQKDGSEVRLLSAHAGEAHVLAARTRGQVLDWGARLAPAHPDMTGVLGPAMHSRSDMIVGVCAAEAAAAARIRALAGGREVLMILIGEPGTAPSSLHGAGIRVATVAPDEVESWFESGSIAS